MFSFSFFNFFWIFFAMFYVDMGHLIFFYSFFVFFMCTVFGIPDIERRKKRNLLIGQSQGSLSESRWFVLFICFILKFTFYRGLPT